MKKVDLTKVLDLLIAEDKAAAEALLHEWIIDRSKIVLEELMQEDDDVLDGIKDDLDEIETEEYYGDVDLSEDENTDEEDDAEMLDGDVSDEDDFTDSDWSEDDNEFDDASDDLSDEMEVNDDDFDSDMDSDVDTDMDSDMDVDLDMPDEDLEDKVENLEDQLAALKAEFDELMGATSDDFDDEEDVDSEETDDEQVDSDEDLEDDVTSDEGSDEYSDEDSEEDDTDEDETTNESFDEDDDLETLEEAFELKPVKMPDMTTSKEVGSESKSLSDNNKSPIPQKKTSDRKPGEPVKIKSSEHKGFERETAPEVKDIKGISNQVKKAKDGFNSNLVKDGNPGKSEIAKKQPEDKKAKGPFGGDTNLRGKNL
jgi:hypothetical protein